MRTEKFKRPLVIVNPVSGSGKASRRCNSDWKELNTIYPRMAGYVTRQPGDCEGIRHAIEDVHPDLLIVYGGDGTLNDVLNGSDAILPIALVPSGSGNDFASLLDINRKRSVTERLQSPEIKMADLGMCNGRWFANGLGIGFDGEIARHTVSNESRIPASLKYFLAIFRSILFYKEPDSVISWDDNSTMNGRYLMITVANGKRYGGSFMVAPFGKVDDGRLDLVAIEKVSPLLRLWYLPLVIAGRHLNLSFVRHTLAKTVVVQSKTLLPAHVDGELMMTNRYEVSICPGKLGFVV